MFNFLTKIFDSNEKTVKSFRPLAEEINSLRPNYQELSDSDLKAKTAEFKLRLGKGESPDDLLPDAFAAVREAARRATGLEHFDVQLMAGIAFHRGIVAEQKTGEGKTLSATTALYLNGLTGRGAHLVTVNDYLARRDCGWMGPIYHLLGMTVGVIYAGQGDQPAGIYDPEYKDPGTKDERLAHLKPVSRKEAYAADITYGTNNEFGFDYLRDNMATDLSYVGQRGHHFAIVDEVDSILVDEARTPLIISAPDAEPTDKYYQFFRLIDELNPETDYTIDEKLRVAQLTDRGLKKLEKKLGIDNLYEKNFASIHHAEQALRARSLYRKDKDYVVKDDQVIIVDEHTGRLMFGRRYSDGLHQAIEAKEGVKIQQESKTLATISLQNYFRMYQKLSGMTGTAATEAEEFKKIYKLEVVTVPTHLPVARTDHPDQIYKTQRAKYAAIAAEVTRLYQKGQPVLLGTRSIEINEVLSDFLKHKKIPHQVLNAKNHEREAQILAQAGRFKAVTVATNMAGRGVDIVLGGSPPDRPPEITNEKFKKTKEYKDWQAEHEKVVGLGGLFVVGSERHESRRIDNQLRGRSGRQGDQGESRFYISLEDEIMRIFGGDKIASLMTTLKMPENEPIEHGLVSRAIEQAQAKVESWFFDQRKRVVEYDDVVNKQREIIYKRRRKILEETGGPEFDEKSWKRIEKEIEFLVAARSAGGYNEVEISQMVREFSVIIPFDDASQKRLEEKLRNLGDEESMANHLIEVAKNVYQKRKEQLGPETATAIEKYALLGATDQLWMEHLDMLDDLREGIGLRGYAQKEPLVEYQKEAFDMFESLLNRIDSETVRRIYRIQPAGIKPEPIVADIEFRKPEAASNEPGAMNDVVSKQGLLDSLKQKAKFPFGQNQEQKSAFMSAFKKVAINRPSGAPVRNDRRIGRNDPCWCGKTKPDGTPVKYKHCHYPN